MLTTQECIEYLETRPSLEDITKLNNPTLLELIKAQYPVIHLRLAVDRFSPDKDSIIILDNKNTPDVLLKYADEDFDYLYIPYGKYNFVYDKDEATNRSVIRLQFVLADTQRAKLIGNMTNKRLCEIYNVTSGVISEILSNKSYKDPNYIP